MPRMVSYPRASLKAALELAGAVAGLGGSCTEDMAGESMGKSSKGGAFQAIINATVKYGLAETSKGMIAITPLFRDYKLAYDEAQRVDALQRAFLGVPLFSQVYERFLGNQIPREYLDKLLAKEFGVPEDVASRVGDYFIEGARMVRLLNDVGVVLSRNTQEGAAVAAGDGDAGREVPEPDVVQTGDSKDSFVVKITGPGVSTTITVRGEDDLAIVQAVLKKVAKALEQEGVGRG